MFEIDPNRLKALRQGKKWSRAQLGEEANRVSPRQIARIESKEGITSVREHTLKQLASALKVDARVLSGEEPLPDEFSDAVSTEAFIDPSRLRALRDGLKLSRDKLANQSGVSARQIARIEGQEEPAVLRPQTLASLARALDVESAVLTGEKSLPPTRPQSDGVRLSVQTGSATRLDYDLVRHRYGVTTKQVIDLAPLLFTMLAESSLAWRREKLKQVKQKVSDLRELTQEHGQLHHAVFQTDPQGCLELEDRSIGEADLQGAVVTAAHPWIADFTTWETPFTDFMRKVVSEIGQPDIVSFEFEDDGLSWELRPDLCGVGPVRLCGKYIDEVTGGSKHAQWALLSGEVRLSDIPDELMPEDAKAQRVEWLEDRLSSQTREANERWEEWGEV